MSHPSMENRIAALEAEIARLQETVARYKQLLPTGEAALEAIAEIEETPHADL